MKVLFIIFSLFSIISCNSEASDQKDLIIVDVRTAAEWKQDGYAKCAVNYPLDRFASHINELKEYKNVFLVCRSGNRAETAKELLFAAGYNRAVNKGSWQNIECK